MRRIALKLRSAGAAGTVISTARRITSVIILLTSGTCRPRARHNSGRLLDSEWTMFSCLERLSRWKSAACNLPFRFCSLWLNSLEERTKLFAPVVWDFACLLVWFVVQASCKHNLMLCRTSSKGLFLRLEMLVDSPYVDDYFLDSFSCKTT